MALSSKARKALDIALGSSELVSQGGSNSVSKEIADAIDSNGSGPAADVAANSHSSAPTIALSTSDTYTDAAVNSAVNAALSTTNSNLNATRDQINAILAALKAAGMML